MLFAWFGVNGVARVKSHDFTIARLNSSFALDHMQVLTARMTVPIGSPSRPEPHQQRAAGRVVNENEIVA
jgi:hypothetical protein